MRRSFTLLLLVSLFSLAGCSDDVASEEDARRAYLGLDASVDKSMQLGFQGFNAATNANIDPQSGMGAKGGAMIISGKVDQGASANKTMTLNIDLNDYTDDGAAIYNTGGTLPILDLKLANIPSGTMNGTLVGTYDMSGELLGKISMNLSISGDLQPTAADPNKVERKPGTTKITGTAESDYGVFDVNITR